MLPLTVITLTSLATALLLFPARAVLRRAGIVDRPNGRSSHAVPTIRGGGVAIVAVIAGVLGLLCVSTIEVRPTDAGTQITWSAFEHVDGRLVLLFAGFVLLAVVSFVDDVKGLKARIRFTVHALCSVAAVVLLTNNSQPITVATAALAAVATLWITGYTNAFNFMDGINGIAGMQALSTGLGTAAVAIALGVPTSHPSVILALATAGAALGFLPHNFPRARVFMGDVSSAALGFLLAVLAVWVARQTSWWVLFWLGLLHANFVLDTAITLVRRALRGERLHDAHREHFYQRLVRAGQSHTRVTLTQAALQAGVAMALWQATNATTSVRWIVAGGIVALWCAYFAHAERVFRRSQRAAAVTATVG